MRLKHLYFCLSVLGLVLPYSQFLPFVEEHGLDLRLIVQQLFANRISAFFGLDVIVSAVVLLVFMGVEGRRLAMRRRWVPLVALLTVGVSLALPLFLYQRVTHQDAAG
ncbi:MAG TPA: DUF2834 domain-containing protein [Gemmatimonadales bacterium]|jgi:hypothetical protein